ncbi:MAG TPA: VOC family protein [Flavobacterium sp.]|nr:VOC family protein [Flavobacterium sp.]
METKVFFSFAVKDLKKSVEFFTKVGFTFNPMFTDETATCMIISETIYAMLLTEDKFKSFTKKQIADTSKTQEVAINLTAGSREAVDAIIEKALAAGASEPSPAQDQGFMYSREFEDPDGHNWSYFYMDMSALPKQ